MSSSYEWKPLAEGTTNETRRPYKLQEHPEGGYRVVTIQRGDAVIHIPSQAPQHVFPAVISDGDEIHVEGETVEELEIELRAADFSTNEAKEICLVIPRIPKY